MKFMTNFNFYRHHIFSIIISFLFTSFFGIIIIQEINVKNNIIYSLMILLLNMIFNAINKFYSKYLLDTQKISFYVVGSFFGFIDLMTLLIINFSFKINFNIFDVFNSLGVINVLRIIFSIVCFSIFYYIYYRMIYENSVIHGEIIYIFLYIINSLSNIFYHSINKYFQLLILLDSIIILFSILIYVEFIELNFCGLNDNIRKNILKREKDEQKDLDKILNEEAQDLELNSKVEVTDGYLIEFNQNK